jgi:hypothetical protein
MKSYKSIAARTEGPISVATDADSEAAGGMYSRAQLLRGYMLLEAG